MLPMLQKEYYHRCCFRCNCIKTFLVHYFRFNKYFNYFVNKDKKTFNPHWYWCNNAVKFIPKFVPIENIQMHSI